MSNRHLVGILLALVVPGLAYLALIAGADPSLTMLIAIFGIIIALIVQVRGRLEK